MPMFSKLLSKLPRRTLKWSKINCLSSFTTQKYNFSNRTTVPSERNWDPNSFYPNEPGHVRVTGITLRDGHQSLNGGMHRIDLLEKAAQAIDKIRPPHMKYPGHEEIGGGTTVDFPLRFKGENPFRNMERISRHLPNTPTSMLCRSDSLCGYNVNPRDIVRGFIKRYAECGLDIFRNFDAYNNVANHATVAEAVLEAGKHYQAAITFTSHEDPTLFNVKWVSDLAKEFQKLGAHSICIKDMAGIASPALMKAWVTELKQSVPELPVIIHSHYTTGFSPITYLQAIEAGASAVDCGISTLSGRSGHPAMEVFNQVLYDMGYDLGWEHNEALEAMKDVANIYREYHPRYEFCEMKMAGTVDYRVFTQGIPGGQISIMRNELVSQGFGHLFDPVIEQIQRVRTQVGGVALVTPTSEHVARQSIVNAMNGLTSTTDESPLWPGYSEMLRGVMGRPPAKMDQNLQLRALREFANNLVTNLVKAEDNYVTKEIGDDIKENCIPKLVSFLWTLSEPIRNDRDRVDLEDRIRQLTQLDSKLYSQQIKESQNELNNLIKNIPVDIKQLDSNYTRILSRNPDDKLYRAILSESGLERYSNTLSRDVLLDIIVASSFCTVCPSSIIPEGGLERSMLEVEKLAVDNEFDYIPQRGTKEFEEWAILQCMFKHAQNIAITWFKQHRSSDYIDQSVWDEKWWPVDFPFDRPQQDIPVTNFTMYPYLSNTFNNNAGSNINWSETELKRVLQSDITQLATAKRQLQTVNSYIPENQYRETLKEREVNKLTAQISDLTNIIETKIKNSLYNVKSHEAGYVLNISQSIQTNVDRAIALG